LAVTSYFEEAEDAEEWEPMDIIAGI